MKRIKINEKIIEYEILELKTKMKIKELCSMFDRGAVVLYSPLSDPDTIEVLGWFTYDVSLKEEDITAVMMNDNEHPLYAYQILVIKPIKIHKTSRNGYWIVQRIENEEYEFRRKSEAVSKVPLAPIAEEIKTWVEDNEYAMLKDYLCSRVKGQEDVEYLAAEVYVYLKAISQGRQIHNNIILAAPSGCGKTEVFRAIRDFFKKEIPSLVIAQTDVSNVTETAYRGADPKSVVSALVESPKSNGVGIVFLDEFDKKIMPSWSNHGNVNLAVQGQLLTIIEGSIQSFQRNVNGRNTEIQIDTSNTMFIACGAFDNIRTVDEKKHKFMGFNRPEEQESKDHYMIITKDDMTKMGASSELLGRFSVVINFHKLNRNVVDEIIDGFVGKLSDELECKVTISEEYREALHERSNSKYGCRFLESTMREDAMKGYIKILKEDSKDASTIFLNKLGDVEVINK